MLNIKRLSSQFVFALALLASSVALQSLAFTEPTASPPLGNVGAPINTGGVSQDKNASDGTAWITADGLGSRYGALLATQSGVVGIGTASPGAEKLTVAGVTGYNSGIKVTGSSAAGVGVALENTISGGHKYDLLSGGASNFLLGGLGIFDETAGAYRITVTSAGNVGIGGTATPAGDLDVNDGTGAATICLNGVCKTSLGGAYDSTVSGYLARTWQDVASSRSFGTQYTNSNSYPINISVYGIGGTYCTLTLAVGASTASTNILVSTTQGAANQYCMITSVIPPGWAYKITSSAGSISSPKWFELR